MPMARQDNPFSLLGEDDDGDDLAVLLAKVEAKISASAISEEEPPKPPVDGFPSKPLPPAEYIRAERDRGRGGRGRVSGRGSFRPQNNGGADDVSGRIVDGYSRGFGSDSGGRGRGGGRGGRGRGRGRGFYEGRGFDNENQYDAGVENHCEGGDELDERSVVQGKNYDHLENHELKYENRKFGEQRSLGWEEKGFDSDNRRFRGSDSRQRRGFGGGRQGYRGGGVGQRYVERETVLEGRSDKGNESNNKEDAPNGKEIAENNARLGDNASGWDMPATTNVQKDEVHNEDQKLISGEVPGEQDPKEEDNEMTLHEYEKVLKQKRMALEFLKIEERKVVLDKDLESMQLVEKKKEDNFVKLKIEKEKLKKKDSFEKEEKVRKAVMSINEFLKPAEGERYIGPSSFRGRGRGRVRGDHGGFRGGYTGGRGSHNVPAAPHFEDPVQFPLLGATAKA
ncbi:keratin, type I cytoskeletal 9-like isoform X1 [Canna indica]|uniref:Keratin, type I cytoskeletal 9-like isoform X1 n=1 Tax=Canna indica TaxID=4628 RepID=A0AAQ3KVJ5_9LILI|nr:keratin, type I cytoskeletal 9-like isoform X1 [Canna indica]